MWERKLRIGLLGGLVFSVLFCVILFSFLIGILVGYSKRFVFIFGRFFSNIFWDFICFILRSLINSFFNFVL